MFALGVLNSGGYDIAVDRAVAQRWFVAAAERGHKEALKTLGGHLSSEPEGVMPQGLKGRDWLAPPATTPAQQETATQPRFQ
jgi:hypothetical protein